MRSLLMAGVALVAMAGGALAAEGCPNPDALGTSRVVTVDPKAMPLLGTLQYKQTIPLQKGEVILTFDDGPLPPYTTRVLDTLKAECVKATFFIVGTMARAHPAVLQRVVQDGHSIGTHSQTHPLIFPKLTQEAGLQEIQKGFASTDAALAPINAHAGPFFRFPGLGRTKFYESYLQQNGISVFSVDLVADDWMHLKPDEVMKRALDRLEARGSGILLLHDIQPSTAVMLPAFLKELKARGFKVVHVEPATTTPVALAPGKPAAPATVNVQPAAVPAGAPATTTAVAVTPAKPASVPRPVPSPLAQPAVAPVAEAEPAPKNPVETFFNQLWPRLLPDMTPKPNGQAHATGSGAAEE
ncbi:polysaccharide deacetylase family protein [Aquabacter sp. L1I39]|uniref:polysaccharide deacetylase family protein n=1 Tax=Aquabacter sp. L1I39 TaxID=2820278 RepID=UPI001ADCDAEA|nr:polysaccharide deacetylase family protein [Aquabacter sp. L1I39]QTL02585.1 polysaccharide deacetylase family protein [Aquabacter sp. L1I39]